MRGDRSASLRKARAEEPNMRSEKAALWSVLAEEVAAAWIEARSFMIGPRLCVCVPCACSAAFGHVLPGVSLYLLCFQKGRSDSGSAYRGSNPWGAAKQPLQLLYVARHPKSL